MKFDTLGKILTSASLYFGASQLLDSCATTTQTTQKEAKKTNQVTAKDTVNFKVNKDSSKTLEQKIGPVTFNFDRKKLDGYKLYDWENRITYIDTLVVDSDIKSQIFTTHQTKDDGTSPYAIITNSNTALKANSFIQGKKFDSYYELVPVKEVLKLKKFDNPSFSPAYWDSAYSNLKELDLNIFKNKEFNGTKEDFEKIFNAVPKGEKRVLGFATRSPNYKTNWSKGATIYSLLLIDRTNEAEVVTVPKTKKDSSKVENLPYHNYSFSNLRDLSFGYNSDGLFTTGLRWDLIDSVVTNDSMKIEVRNPFSLGFELGYGKDNPNPLVVQDPSNPVTNLSFNGRKKTSENKIYLGPEASYHLSNSFSIAGGLGLLLDLKSEDVEEYWINANDPQKNKLGLNNDKSFNTKLKYRYGLGPEFNLGRLNIGVRTNNFFGKNRSYAIIGGYKFSK